MDKLLETYNLSRLNHEIIIKYEQTNHREENKSIIKNLPINKNLELDSFTGEFYQIFKEFIPVLYTSSKTKNRNTFYLILCTLTTKTRQNIIKEKYRQISLIEMQIPSAK